MLVAHAILIVNGKYALQLRDDEAPTCPGMWGLFGGAIEPGESPYHAIKRELMEELELAVDDPKLLVNLYPWAVFYADVSDQWEHRVQHEGLDASTFTVAEVMKLDCHQMVRDMVSIHNKTQGEGRQ